MRYGLVWTWYNKNLKPASLAALSMKKWKFGGRTRFLDLQLESHLEVDKPATLFQFFTCQSWRSWLRVNWQMPKMIGNTSESSNKKMENLPFTNNCPSYKPPFIRRLFEEWLMCTHPPQRFCLFLGFVKPIRKSHKQWMTMMTIQNILCRGSNTQRNMKKQLLVNDIHNNGNNTFFNDSWVMLSHVRSALKYCSNQLNWDLPFLGLTVWPRCYSRILVETNLSPPTHGRLGVDLQGILRYYGILY